jgi:hypothetical protein
MTVRAVVAVLKSLLLILRRMVLCGAAAEAVEAAAVEEEEETEDEVEEEEEEKEDEVVVAVAEEEEAVPVLARIAVDVGCILRLHLMYSQVLRVLEDWLPILRLLVEEVVLRLGSHLEVVDAAVLHLV